MREKPINKPRSLTRALLKLLKKFIDFERLLQANDGSEPPNRYAKTINVIKKVHCQQNNYFFEGEKPTRSIISLHKDDVRPIVRGKQIKLVEFGSKVNKIQIKGMSFI